MSSVTGGSSASILFNMLKEIEGKAIIEGWDNKGNRVRHIKSNLPEWQASTLAAALQSVSKQIYEGSIKDIKQEDLNTLADLISDAKLISSKNPKTFKKEDLENIKSAGVYLRNAVTEFENANKTTVLNPFIQSQRKEQALQKEAPPKSVEDKMNFEEEISASRSHYREAGEQLQGLTLSQRTDLAERLRKEIESNFNLHEISKRVNPSVHAQGNPLVDQRLLVTIAIGKVFSGNDKLQNSLENLLDLPDGYNPNNIQKVIDIIKGEEPHTPETLKEDIEKTKQEPQKEAGTLTIMLTPPSQLELQEKIAREAKEAQEAASFNPKNLTKNPIENAKKTFFYHKDTNTEQAKKILSDKPPGSYLLHEIEPGVLAIRVNNEKVSQLVVEHDPFKGLAIKGSDIAGPTIEKLIQEFEKSLPGILKHPVRFVPTSS